MSTNVDTERPMRTTKLAVLAVLDRDGERGRALVVARRVRCRPRVLKAMSSSACDFGEERDDGLRSPKGASEAATGVESDLGVRVLRLTSWGAPDRSPNVSDVGNAFACNIGEEEGVVIVVVTEVRLPKENQDAERRILVDIEAREAREDVEDDTVTRESRDSWI